MHETQGQDKTKLLELVCCNAVHFVAATENTENQWSRVFHK